MCYLIINKKPLKKNNNCEKNTAVVHSLVATFKNKRDQVYNLIMCLSEEELRPASYSVISHAASRWLKQCAKMEWFIFMLFRYRWNILMHLYYFSCLLLIFSRLHSIHMAFTIAPGLYEWHLWEIRNMVVVKVRLPCVVRWSWHLSRTHAGLV